MSQAQLDQILNQFGAMAAQWNEQTNLDVMRTDFQVFFSDYPEAPQSKATQAKIGCDGELTRAGNASENRVVLLLHGGGYSMGSARAHRSYASHLSAACDAQVFSADYRLAPEHTCPAALEDAMSAFGALVSMLGSAKRISICGDSAGAGLALSLAIQLRRIGHEQPSSIILVSPWADLECKGPSYIENADKDPISNREMALGMAATYLGTADESDIASASPLLHSFDGLAPIQVLAGGREVFLDDAKTIANRANEAGIYNELLIHPSMIHQWPIHAGKLEEADIAIESIGHFVKKKWHS